LISLFKFNHKFILIDECKENYGYDYKIKKKIKEGGDVYLEHKTGNHKKEFIKMLKKISS
jgi:hypothetical protein